MTPEQAIDKLQRMKKWGKMTDVKREALDMAIQAIESHDVEKKIDNRSVVAVNGVVSTRMYCPCCDYHFGYSSVVYAPRYCSNCGQKLKAPWKWHYENQNYEAPY